MLDRADHHGTELQPRRGKRKVRYQRLHKDKASRAPAGTSIEKRPEEAKDRDVFGHWEGDTVYSAKNTSRAALFTLTERKTRKEIILKVKNRKATTISHALDRLEKKLGVRKFRAIFRSITVDNGSEFADTVFLLRAWEQREPERHGATKASEGYGLLKGLGEGARGDGGLDEQLSAEDVRLPFRQ